MIARRSSLILILSLAAGARAAAPRIPGDAPYCAPPAARPLFLSPMGEPFRGERGRPWPAAVWFAAADTDHDGALSRAEFVAEADRFFRTIDLDRDGRITPDEVIAYERDTAPEIAVFEPRARDYAEPVSRDRGTNGSPYGGAMGAGRYSWLNIPEPVSSADADVDRIVTEDEFRQSAARRFDALAGAAGRLTPAAVPATPYQRAIEGPCRPRPKPRGRKGDERRDELDRPGDRADDPEGGQQFRSGGTPR